MKIKRYVAPTMREAIAEVRAEQGPEAVILSNRRIDSGMEIIAAVDYDESLMSHALAQIAPKVARQAQARQDDDGEPVVKAEVRESVEAARSAAALTQAPQRNAPASRETSPRAAAMLERKPQASFETEAARLAAKTPGKPAAPTRPATAQANPGSAPVKPATAQVKLATAQVKPATQAKPQLQGAERIRAAQVEAIGLSRMAQQPGTGIESADDFDLPSSEATPFAPPRANAASRIEWSQDPAIVSMRDEVHSMRELLESQLASLAWNEMGRRQPLKSKVLRDLAALDIAPQIAREIVAEMPNIDNLKDSWRVPLGLLVKRIPVTDDGLLEHGGVVAIVGPTGVGKTTTIAKIAARFALKHGAHHVALVSTDTYRIGAREQLHTYARILGVTMHVAQDSRELASVLESLENRKLVLIDTAGMSQRDLRLNEQFATLRNDRARIRVLLALSAAAEYSALDETVRVFEKILPSACVLTKVDEAASLGAPLSIAIRHGLSIAHICDGQRVPEDLHAAFSRRSWLVQTAVKMRRDSQRVADEGFLAEQFGRMAAHA